MVPAPPKDNNQAEELERLCQKVAELEQRLAQRTQTEEELERVREFSEMVLNSMQDAIYVVGAQDYQIIDCNQVFLQTYGLKRDEVIGRTCYEVKRGRTSPCDTASGSCPSLDTFRTGQVSQTEFSFYNQQGDKVHMECTTLPVCDRQGRITRVVHVDRDITHRSMFAQRLQEANRELARSNAFLRNLIRSSVDAVIAADMSGQILIFNTAAGQITGYSEREALTELKIWDIYPGDGAREVMRKLRSKDRGGKGKLRSHEVALLAKDGSVVPISLSASAVYEAGVEVGTVGFFYDLREKRAMERELDKTRTQLLQAEKMASIGKLAAGVAHQVNNPLAGITLFAHLLLEEYELEQDVRKDLGRILDNAQRCRDTIKELLQFARQTSQETRLADLNDALSRTLFLLENQSLFQNIEIVRQLDPDLPKVPADIQQLSHVFMNLVLNAAEAMGGQGSIFIKTYPAPEGDRVMVEISDHGPGIPPEVMPHLFEPFFTTKDEGKGTGLGLSVAYGVIENHHGRIYAQSRPGEGATFFIELPLAGRGEES